MPVVIVVDGIIAAGKSTFIRALAEWLTTKKMYGKICVVPEPVDQWKTDGVLQYFYEDVATRSYEFQTYVFATRVQSVRKAFFENPDANIFLLERSVVSDEHFFVEMLIESGNINSSQVKMYQQWSTMWKELLPFTPDGFIYLRPTLDESMQRLQIRNRSGEDGISSDYQQKLLDKHDLYFNTNSVSVDTKSCPVLKLEGNFDSRKVFSVENKDENFSNSENSSNSEIQDKVTSFISKLYNSKSNHTKTTVIQNGKIYTVHLPSSWNCVIPTS
jgi:deoxyadenosine/deoxycytidine kinase